jgi:hypothetical protein
MRAFFHAKLNLAERAVFQYVMERTWTESSSCEINASALEKTWGYHRVNLSNAKNGLVSDGLLLKIEGRFSINKDVDSARGIEFNSNSIELRVRERDAREAIPDETDNARPIEYLPATEEPFASPEALHPIPAPTRTPEEGRLADSVAVATRKATRREGYPDGIPDAVEAMTDWALDSLRDGAKVSAIKDSVGKACRKLADGMDWGSGPSYANTCLRSWKADPAVKSSGDAWKPAPPPVKYWNVEDYLEEGKRS